jgi:BarA-like signal transduction histidine kinase
MNGTRLSDALTNFLQEYNTSAIHTSTGKQPIEMGLKDMNDMRILNVVHNLNAPITVKQKPSVLKPLNTGDNVLVALPNSSKLEGYWSKDVYEVVKSLKPLQNGQTRYSVKNLITNKRSPIVREKLKPI